MRIILPITIIVFLLLTSLIPPVKAADESPTETVGTVNQNDPSWGENIDITKRAEPGGLFGDTTEVGPEKNQLKFPDLTSLNSGLGESFQFLLPRSLLNNLQLPAPQPLEGKIFHPPCEIRGRGQGVPISGQNLAKGASTVETPGWWPQLLAATKLSQAIAVPGKNSGVKFEVVEHPDFPSPEQGNSTNGCPQPEGELGGQTETTAVTGGTKIDLSLLERVQSVINFLVNIFRRDLSPESVTVVAKPKQYLAGESEFADQTSEEEGFLRSFCPQNLCGDKPVNEQEDTPYRGLTNDQAKRLEYQGVAFAREGYKILAESLYPAGLQELIYISPGGGLNFTIPYRDASFQISEETKQKVIKAVLQNWPNSKIVKNWDRVVSQSITNGINPAFSLAVWIEESGASHYNNHFSCPPKETDFDKSFQCYIKTTLSINPTNFEAWARNYCGTPADQPICTNDNNEHFLGNLKSWWDQFNK